MSTPLDQSVLCPVLVGRAPLAAAAERLTTRACTGKDTIVLLAGESGIGLSCLWEGNTMPRLYPPSCEI